MCATKTKKTVKKASETKKAASKTSAPKAKGVKEKKSAVKDAPAKKKSASKTAEAKVKVEKAKKPKPQPVKADVSKMSTNPAQNLVFKFAEMRKKAHLEAERKEAESRMVIKPGRRPTTRQKGTDTLRFSDADLASFRKVLLDLRNNAIGQSHSLKENALEQTEDRSREDDDGSDVTIRLQNLSQVDVKSKDIQKIDEALRRIEKGTYGICEECGQLIRKQRLAHMPTAHHCIECQQKIEKSGR